MASERATMTLLTEPQPASGTVVGQLDSGGRTWSFSSWLALNSALRAALDAAGAEDPLERGDGGG